MLTYRSKWPLCIIEKLWDYSYGNSRPANAAALADFLEMFSPSKATIHVLFEVLFNEGIYHKLRPAKGKGLLIMGCLLALCFIERVSKWSTLRSVTLHTWI